MKNNNTLILLCAAILISLAALLHFKKHYVKITDLIEITDTVTVRDTIWKDTTITHTTYIPKYVEVLKTDTLYKQNGDTVHLLRESKTYQDTIISDKDTAEVQIHVSGVETSLDSLKMRLRTHNTIVTNTVTKYAHRKRSFADRFHISLQVGYGYGFKYKGIEPYAGIGVSFDL